MIQFRGRIRRSIVAAVCGSLLVAGGVIASAQPASAACGYSSPVDLQSAFTSQGYAGVETTTKIPFVFKYSDAGCLQGMIFTFIGGGGTDVQAVRANVSTGGVGGEAVATWIPKPMEYKLLVDVVYEYGIFGTVSTSRWTYDGPLGGKAFVPLPAPSAPVSPLLSGLDRKLMIQWQAPTSNASAVTRYVVKYPDGTVLCEVPPGTLSCEALDQPDATYAFIIAALNQIGQGAEVATGPLQVGPPNPPAVTGLSVRGQSVNIRWSANTGTSAYPVMYRVSDSSGAEVCSVAPPATTAIAEATVSCQFSVPAGQTTQLAVTVETNLGTATSAPTPAVTSTNPSASKACKAAKSAYAKAVKAKNKKAIAKAKKAVSSRCKPKTVNYL